jgi:hypothetical protein
MINFLKEGYKNYRKDLLFSIEKLHNIAKNSQKYIILNYLIFIYTL